MTPEIELVASSADAELAGPPATSGGARSSETPSSETPSGGALVVALGDARSHGSRARVRWLDRVARPEDGGDQLVIAPAGEGLWRRAPWPAADALFDLPPVRDGATLLVGAAGGLRDAVAGRGADRGVAIEAAERLDAAALARAACVVIADSPGAALPARAFAVLAAGRLLIVPRLQTTFGLEDGLDHLEFADPDEAVTAVEAYRADPETFGRVVSWGRLKAGQQSASVVYARLADDLRLQGLAGLA